MGKLILLTIFLIYCEIAFSQDDQLKKDATREWRIGLSANIGNGKPVRPPGAQDWGGYEGKGSISYGMQFFKNLSLKSSIKFGFLYSSYKVRYNSDPENPNPVSVTENFNSIFLPILYNRNFKHQFHFGVGTMVEFALPRNSYPIYIDSQSGFGLITEFGKEFQIKRLVLDLSPNLEIHSIIPFNSEDDQQRILVLGVRFGLYYNFK